MARRDRNVEARYTFSELMDMLRGTSVNTPRKRQELRNITKDVNIPEILPSDSTSLLTSEPKELTNKLMDMKPSTDIVTGKTNNMKTLIKPSISEPKQKTNLLTKEEEKQIAKDPVALQNYTKAGNFFARVGGFRQATPEQISQATPEQLNIYNTQRLAARNKGIGEMLLMLSDALGGKDVAMRAIERQKAKQPTPVKATEAIKQEELAVLQRLKELNGDVSQLNDYETLIYNNFIKREDAESILSKILSGELGETPIKQEPIKITQIEEG